MSFKNRSPLYGDSIFISFICYPGLKAWGLKNHFTKLESAIKFFELSVDLKKSHNYWFNEIQNLSKDKYYRIRIGFDLHSKSLGLRSVISDDFFANPVIYIENMESPTLKLIEHSGMFLLKTLDKAINLPCKISSLGIESLFMRKLGVQDFLWVSENGTILESSTANIFFFNPDKNCWFYPKREFADSHIYEGVTQEFFKEFLQEMGLNLMTKNLQRDDLESNFVIIGTNSIVGFKIINPIVGKIIKVDLKLKNQLELLFHQFHHWLEEKLCKISIPKF